MATPIIKFPVADQDEVDRMLETNGQVYYVAVGQEMGKFKANKVYYDDTGRTLVCQGVRKETDYAYVPNLTPPSTRRKAIREREFEVLRLVEG